MASDELCLLLILLVLFPFPEFAAEFDIEKEDVLVDINIFESNSLNRKVRADKVGLLALPQRSLTLEAKHIMAASTFKCVKSIGSGSSPAII